MSVDVLLFLRLFTNIAKEKRFLWDLKKSMFIVNNDFLEKGILSRLKKRINWFVKYARGRSSFAKLQEFARG